MATSKTSFQGKKNTPKGKKKSVHPKQPSPTLLQDPSFQRDLKLIAEEDAARELERLHKGRDVATYALKIKFLNPQGTWDSVYDLFLSMKESLTNNKEFSSDFPPSSIGDYKAFFPEYFQYFCAEFNRLLLKVQVEETGRIVEEIADHFQGKVSTYQAKMKSAVERDLKEHANQTSASGKWEFSLDVVRSMLEEFNACSKHYPIHYVTFWENRDMQSMCSDIGDIFALLLHAENEPEILFDLDDDMEWIFIDKNYSEDGLRGYLYLETAGAIGSHPLAPLWFVDGNMFFLNLCANQLHNIAYVMKGIFDNWPDQYKGILSATFYETKMGKIVSDFIEHYKIDKSPEDLEFKEPKKVGVNFEDDLRRIFHWRDRKENAESKHLTTTAMQTLLHALVGRLTEAIVMEVPDAMPFLFA